MKVLIYVDHLQVFANELAANRWFEDNDPLGVAVCLRFGMGSHRERQHVREREDGSGLRQSTLTKIGSFCRFPLLPRPRLSGSGYSSASRIACWPLVRLRCSDLSPSRWVFAQRWLCDMCGCHPGVNRGASCVPA